MGYRDVASEGPAAHAVSAWVSFVNKDTGLTDVQTLSVLSELVKCGPIDAAEPGFEEWHEWLRDADAAIAACAALSDRRRASLRGRLARGSTGLPRTALWFALRHLRRECADRRVALADYLRRVAEADGVPEAEVENRFAQLMAAAGTARANGDGREARTVYRGTIPADFATVEALRRLQDGRAGVARERPLLVHRRLARGGESYGYDPERQRLEVTSGAATRVYRVPIGTVQKLEALRYADWAGTNFLRGDIAASVDHRWFPDSPAAFVCRGCGATVPVRHMCEGLPGNGFQRPVELDLAIGPHIRVSDGSVVIVRSSRTSAGDALKHPTRVPVIVIISDVDTADALPVRYAVTGHVAWAAGCVDARPLRCTCPSRACLHRGAAASMVRAVLDGQPVPSAAAALRAERSRKGIIRS